MQWLNFSPKKIFHDQYCSLIFFHLTKNLSRFFFQLLLISLFPIYLQNLLLPCFFWCTLFIVVEQSSFNKNFEMRVKVNLKVKLVREKWRIWKTSRGKVSIIFLKWLNFSDFFSLISYIDVELPVNEFFMRFHQFVLNFISDCF